MLISIKIPKEKNMHIAIREISTIIERDSKDTTYKFALLRACIQVTQEYSHYAVISKDEATYPMGLIILKWIEYYYAIFEDDRFIPQRNGDSPQRSLAFRKAFNAVIDSYRSGLGYHQLKRDLKTGTFDSEQNKLVAELVKVLKDTIVKMPMTYIGGAINKGGQIFKYKKDSTFRVQKTTSLTDEHIINTCGTFTIPRNYHDAFMLLGSFITGTRSLLFEWADFTLRADSKKLFTKGEILQLLDPLYDKEREVSEIKTFFEKQKKQDLLCVWSGKPIQDDLNIDHMMPYSLWKNNDFWNLLPTKSVINAKKSDKIPSPDLLDQQKDLIVHYWELVHREYRNRFQKELQLSLLGIEPFMEKNWQNKSFESLRNKCEYLISKHGLEPFKL